MPESIPYRIFRRLTAAEGYLELGLPDYALEQLDGVDPNGAVEAAVSYMTGEALRQKKRYSDAIEPLQRAARLIPVPHNRSAWISLGECFREAGHHELADIIEEFLRSPQRLTVVVPRLARLAITIQPPIDLRQRPAQPADDELQA